MQGLQVQPADRTGHVASGQAHQKVGPRRLLSLVLMSSVRSPFSDTAPPMPVYFHRDCLFNVFRRGKKKAVKIRSEEDVQGAQNVSLFRKGNSVAEDARAGFDSLTDEDQVRRRHFDQS